MDYTYLYSTRIQDTFDEDQAEILSKLKAEFALNPKLEIQLKNYYKGLPIVFNASIAGIDKGTLELDVNPLQAVAIAAERYTFIHIKKLKHDIVAKAQYVNIKRKAASLTQLSYVEIMAERRNHIRLALEPSVNAFFLSPSGTLRGRLVELSMAGTVMETDQANDLKIGEKAKLIFIVPDVYQNTTHHIKVPATLVTISDNFKPTRYRFFITADRLADKLISKYLFHRQIDIIRELKERAYLG